MDYSKSPQGIAICFFPAAGVCLVSKFYELVARGIADFFWIKREGVIVFSVKQRKTARCSDF